MAMELGGSDAAAVALFEMTEKNAAGSALGETEWAYTDRDWDSQNKRLTRRTAVSAPRYLPVLRLRFHPMALR